ncbi:MAG TPA: hypothetical protein VMR31_13820 [Myxococcota bacterium]|nr:hypothetical protein [Myxococcota bacterium]
MGKVPSLIGLGLLCIPLVAGTATVRADNAPTEVNKVDLIPAERAAWTPKNVGIGLSSILGGWGYWYTEREISVETVPAVADLSLYYIRSNFQKRFERAQSPALVKLPSRADMTYKDAVKFHAIANGYLAEEVSYDAQKVPDHVVIQLHVLPNSLVFLGHTEFAGRTSLTLRTTEQPEVRMSKNTSLQGFQIALTKTAVKLEGKPPKGGGHITDLDAIQIAEDAILRVGTDSPDLEVRSRQSFDAVQGQYVYVFDIVAPGTAAPSDQQIRARLDALPFTPNASCDDRYAAVLREKLGDAELADAFRPSGELTDLYRREAMLRLGRYHEGTVQTDTGDTLRTGSSLELALALQSAPRVRGYLALLGALARTEPAPGDAMRTLIAPGKTPAEFAPIYDAAEGARSDCHR